MSVFRRRPGSIAVATAALLAAAFYVAPSANALTDVGGLGIFELDGNPDTDITTAGVDWEDLFTSAGANKPVSLTGASLIQRTFDDDYQQPDTSYFTSNGGGVKDIAPISKWGCKSQSQPTPKDDLFNAYAMLAEVDKPGDPRDGHLILYVGSERQQNQGDAFAGFWINQKEITCNLAAGQFLSDADHQRTNGDLLIVADYKSGGAVQQLAAYEWVGGGTNTTDAANIAPLVVEAGTNLADCANVTADADLCASTNAADVTTDWPPDSGDYPVRTPGTFVEAGLDLTAIYAAHDPPQEVPCFSQLFAETRSSEQPTATLKDFSEDSFDTCAAPAVTTELFEEKGVTDRSLAPTGNPVDPSSYTVTLPAQVYDTVTLSGVSGTPSGTVTYSLWTNNTCTTAATSPLFSPNAPDPDKNKVTVTLNADGSVPNSPTLTFTEPGSFWFKANYSGAGRNLPSESVCATEPLIVAKANPAIATTASDGGVIGVSISDNAVVSGGYFPSPAPADGYGSVTFKLYGPFSSAPAADSCVDAKQIDLAPGDSGTKNAVVAATRDPNDNANNTKVKATSPSYTPTSVGVYQWVASYGGNSQNNAANATACNDTNEDVLIQPETPGIATKISISDRVKVTGTAAAGAISGNVTFTLYGPFNTTPTAASCVDANKVPALVYTPETKAVSNSGEASTIQVPVAEGIYAWGVVFTPDAGSNYTGATSSCEKEVAAIDYTAPSPIP